MVISLRKEIKLFGDFTGLVFDVDDRRYIETLIPLSINKKNYHLFSYVSKQKASYLIIDCLAEQSLVNFQTSANAILLAYAFLKGNYHRENVHILTYKSAGFKEPDSIMFIAFGGGNYDHFPVHSSRPHGLLGMRRKMKTKRNKSGKITGIDDSQLKKYMIEFPEEGLSKMCELICNKGGILRAVILFISNGQTTLEMQIPILFVALENITKALIEEEKGVFNIINDTEIVDQINVAIKGAIKEISKIEKDHKSSKISGEELKEYKASFERVRGKLRNFNIGTNNKKLAKPFADVGYKLSEEESELIFVHRNKFLHGEDFMTMDESYELEFKALFHMSMRIQKLIAVLLLKASGYSGYILNNAKIYEHISERKLNEEIFVAI